MKYVRIYEFYFDVSIIITVYKYEYFGNLIYYFISKKYTFFKLVTLYSKKSSIDKILLKCEEELKFEN